MKKEKLYFTILLLSFSFILISCNKKEENKVNCNIVFNEFHAIISKSFRNNISSSIEIFYNFYKEADKSIYSAILSKRIDERESLFFNIISKDVLISNINVDQCEFTKEEYESFYLQLLKEKRISLLENDFNGAFSISYAFYDINQDYIPELIFEIGGSLYYIYTIEDNIIKYCGSPSISKGIFYTNENENLIYYYGHMDCYNVTILSLKDNILIEDLIIDGINEPYELNGEWVIDGYPTLDSLGYGDYDNIIRFKKYENYEEIEKYRM